jgi:hypothetical protein
MYRPTCIYFKKPAEEITGTEEVLKEAVAK